MSLFKVENSNGRPIALGNDSEGAVPSALRVAPDSFYVQRSEDVLSAKADAELQAWRDGLGEQVLARRAMAGAIAETAQPVAHTILAEAR